MPFAGEEPAGGGVVDVFIIGAGPAGLTAAYCLTKEAPSVLVVEKDPDYVGGICRTIRHDGFLFDIGGHRFFSKSREIVELWHEILPDDFIERPRLSASIIKASISLTRYGHWRRSSNLGPVTSIACILSYLHARSFPIANPRTFHDWVRNAVRRAPVRDFLQDLHREGVGHVLRRDIRGLGRSTHQGPQPRGRHPRRGSAVARLASAGQRQATSVKTLIERFEYPRRGPGMMWEAAARKVEAAGRPSPDGARTGKPQLRLRARSLANRGDEHAQRPRALYCPACHKLGSGCGTDGKDRAATAIIAARASAALPRLHHRRADAQDA